MSDNPVNPDIQAKVANVDIFADIDMNNQDDFDAMDAMDEEIFKATRDEQAEAPASALDDENSLVFKANAIRQAAALEPMLLGKDANLLRYNAETKSFEPVSDDAKHMLAALGEAADISVSNPLSGSHMAHPMKYSLMDGLTGNRAKPQVRVASNLDSKENMKISFENTSNRLARLSSRTQPDAGTLAGETPAPEAGTPNPAGEKGKEEEGQGQGQGQGQGSDTAGQNLANAGANLIATALKVGEAALEASLKLAIVMGGVIAAAYGKIAKIVKDYSVSTEQEYGAGEKMTAVSANDDLYSDADNGIDPTSDPITPDATTNATAALGIAGIADRVRQFNNNQAAPVITEAESIRNTYKASMVDGLSQVESALKLNEIGQIPLVSSSDLENRLKTVSPDEKTRAEKGLSTILTASEKYQKDSRNFLMGNGESRPLDKLDSTEATKQIFEFDKLAADPGAGLEDHQKKLLSNMMNGNVSLGESISSMFSSLRDSFQSALGRISSFGSSHGGAQTVQAQEHTQTEARLG
jgi:hypothetical protein